MDNLQVGHGFDLEASKRLLLACHDSEQSEADMLDRATRALLEGADPNASLPYVSTFRPNGHQPFSPLMAVAEVGYPSVMACLVEQGAWARGPMEDPPDPDGSPTSTEPWHPLTVVFRELGWAVVEYHGEQGKLRLENLNQCAKILMQAGGNPHTVDPGYHKTPMTALLVPLRTDRMLAPTLEADNPYGVGQVLWLALNMGTWGDVEERLHLVQQGQWNMLPVWSSMEDIPELGGWLQSYARQKRLEPVFHTQPPKTATPRF